MPQVKFIGRDCELSTTGRCPAGYTLSSWHVTRVVLEAIDAAFLPNGVRSWSVDRAARRAGRHWRGAASESSTDCLRHWTPNGQSFYCDLAHLEACTSETRDPLTFAAQTWAALRVAELARAEAEARQAHGTRLVLTTSNCDALDQRISFGQHLSVSIDCELWESLFVDPRRPGVLAFVVSALAAAVAFFGSGLVLALKHGRALYSLSGRAHHLRRVIATSTTRPFERGLLHDRREPHGTGQERLHLIGFDASPLASPLLACFVQSVLAAAEAHATELGLADPLGALGAFAWDPAVFEGDGRPVRRAPLADGRRMTLPGYVRELSLALLDRIERGSIPGEHVPRARGILPRVLELAAAFERGDLEACSRHLDWAAKALYLRDLARAQGWELGRPEMRIADHDFGSTAPQGVLQRMLAADLVDPLVLPAAVEAALREGPRDSRGFARGRLVRDFGDDIVDMDWSFVELSRQDVASRPWETRLRVELPRLDSLSGPKLEPALEGVGDVRDLERALQRMQPEPAYERDPLRDIDRDLDVPEQEELCGRWG